MSLQDLSRDELIYFAKLAEQCERFEDMLCAMKLVAAFDQELCLEERNLFSVAFKNVTGQRRAALRVIGCIRDRQVQKGVTDDQRNLMTTDYVSRMERELDQVCAECLAVVQQHCLPRAHSPEARVFFLKMVGDYHRYRAEFKKGDAFADAAKQSGDAYVEAQQLAMDELHAGDPIRLGLALNYSVFQYEILQKPLEATRTARKAFDDAIAELDHLQDDKYKDATLIMQLVRDNITLWTSGEVAEDDAEYVGDEGLIA